MSKQLSSNPYQCQVVTGIFIILCIIYFRHPSWITYVTHKTTPFYDTLDLRSPDFSDFSSEDYLVNRKSRIPMTIHQAWKDENIHPEDAKWIKTWTKNHPRWAYMFWTNNSSRQMIMENYPELLSIFDSYPVDKRHACVMKYIVLYEYGGVFVDLNMESLRPLDTLTRKYSCFLSQTAFEKTLLDEDNIVHDVIFACRAKHPLLENILEKLRTYSSDETNLCGPHSKTLHYRNYISDNHIEPTHNDGLFVAPTEYFEPVVNPSKLKAVSAQCLHFQTLTSIQKKACLSLKHKSLNRKTDILSFSTLHDQKKDMVSPDKTISIFEISPRTKLYRN